MGRVVVKCKGGTREGTHQLCLGWSHLGSGRNQASLRLEPGCGLLCTPAPSSLPATTPLSSAGDLRHKRVGVAALPNAKPSEAEGHCILPVRKLCRLRLSRRKPHSLPEGSVSQLQAFFFHALEVYCHSLNRPPPIQLWAWAITSLTSLNENSHR